MEHAKDGKSVAEQVVFVVGEASTNVCTAIFGENLKMEVSYTPLPLIVNDIMVATVTVKAQDGVGNQYRVEAEMTLMLPDNHQKMVRLDDEPFLVSAYKNDQADGYIYDAWCNSDLINGSFAVVRAILPKNYHNERWLIAGTYEAQVLFRGSFDDMGRKYRRVVDEHWPHLPSVTQERAWRHNLGWDVSFRSDNPRI